jgi:hypothetical protein
MLPSLATARKHSNCLKIIATSPRRYDVTLTKAAASSKLHAPYQNPEELWKPPMRDKKAPRTAKLDICAPKFVAFVERAREGGRISIEPITMLNV